MEKNEEQSLHGVPKMVGRTIPADKGILVFIRICLWLPLVVLVLHRFPSSHVCIIQISVSVKQFKLKKSLFPNCVGGLLKIWAALMPSLVRNLMMLMQCATDESFCYWQEVRLACITHPHPLSAQGYSMVCSLPQPLGENYG